MNLWTLPPEEAARDAALEAHEVNYAQTLAELRQAMRDLYRRRQALQGSLAYVSADDARVIIDSDPRYANLDCKNFLGSLYRGSKEWKATGQRIKSKTPGSHGNSLCCWRWVGDN